MTATESDTAEAHQSRGTTAAQTYFDARNVLTGETDDTTVRQAVEGGSPSSDPRVNGFETGVQNAKTSDSAGVGQ